MADTVVEGSDWKEFFRKLGNVMFPAAPMLDAVNLGEVLPWLGDKVDDFLDWAQFNPEGAGPNELPDFVVDNYTNYYYNQATNYDPSGLSNTQAPTPTSAGQAQNTETFGATEPPATGGNSVATPTTGGDFGSYLDRVTGQFGESQPGGDTTAGDGQTFPTVEPPNAPANTVIQPPEMVGGEGGAPGIDMSGITKVPTINADSFASLLDDLEFSGISISGGGVSGPSQANMNISDALSSQWQGMWANVNAEFDAWEKREINALTEAVMTDWGDTWQHGIAALSDRGLTRPDESTTSDYWQKKWTDERDAAIVRGVRDIQQEASDRRVEWTKYGMDTASDWAKFDVTTKLQQQEMANQFNIASMNNATQAGIASAKIAADMKMFGISSAMDLQKFGVETALAQRDQDINLMTTQAGLESDWNRTLYQGGVQQRGQDIDAMLAQNKIDADWARTQYEGGITQRGQDINYSSDLLSSKDRNTAMQQDWQQWLGNTATTLREQDINAYFAKQGYSQKDNQFNQEMDAYDNANMWNAFGNLTGEIIPWLIDKWG